MYTAVNTAGSTVTLAPNIAPSNYTVSPCKTDETNETLYNNYEFTFIPGVYTVNGTTYILTLKAEDFGEGAKQALCRFCVDHYRRSECRQGG